ncbi:MAG: hypothetical protein U0271_18135 [Polyangiaceae bacterium]
MGPPSRRLPAKKDVLVDFLGNGSARIFLDPRREKVVVPAWFSKQPELILKVGYKLSPPIPDLTIDDQFVVCTLSFNRSPFQCWLPWSAIFAIVSDVDARAVIWPEDVPIESQVLKPSASRPRLASVPGDSTPPSSRGAPSSRRSFAPDKPLSTAPPSSAGSQPKSEPRQEPATLPADPPAKVEPPRAPSPDDIIGSDEAPKKPKRQLPPYLRVVK